MNKTIPASPSVFLPLRPKTLISLWDMIQFALSEPDIFSEEFSRRRFSFRKSENPHSEIPALIKMCDNLIKISARYHLTLTKAYSQKFKEDLTWEFEFRKKYPTTKSSKISYDVVKSKIHDIRNSFSTELRDKKFAYIESNKANFFEQEKLFGKAVYASFPEARGEIKDAGNCLAGDLNTAAVFHLMRVVELGLRELAVWLKVKILNKKLKQIKIPIELGTWEEILTTLQAKLDGLRTTTRSQKREQKIEICNELLKELRSIKDLWRNKVMHTRATYDAKQAESAFEHVRNFMQKLATVKKG